MHIAGFQKNIGESFHLVNREWPHEYEMELATLINEWRNIWGDYNEKLPFILIQLPMFGSERENAWPILRQAQENVSERNENVELLIQIDLGEKDNIHPKDKLSVGQRLGLICLEKIYKEDVIGSSPKLISVAKDNDRIILQFDNVAGGLNFDGKTEEDKDSGFEIAGRDEKFYPAIVTLDFDRVFLHSDKVIDPIFVRYAWYNFGLAKLKGGTGLPVAPLNKIIGD